MSIFRLRMKRSLSNVVQRQGVADGDHQGVAFFGDGQDHVFTGDGLGHQFHDGRQDVFFFQVDVAETMFLGHGLHDQLAGDVTEFHQGVRNGQFLPFRHIVGFGELIRADDAALY